MSNRLRELHDKFVKEGYELFVLLGLIEEENKK